MVYTMMVLIDIGHRNCSNLLHCDRKRHASKCFNLAIPSFRGNKIQMKLILTA
jgi:hypothetical protein